MEPSKALAERLWTEVDRTPVLDVHCHLRSEKPTADSLADILLYHHLWIELVSSGMPATEVSKAGLPHEVADPGMPPEERVRRALPFLHNIRNTTLASFLRTMLEDLYGVPGGKLDESNWEKVFEAVARRAKDPEWEQRLFERECGIERAITVEHIPPLGEARPYGGSRAKRTPRFEFGWEAPDIFFRGRKGADRENLAGLERSLGVELRDAKSYREGLTAAVEKVLARDVRFVGTWLPHNFALTDCSDAQLAGILRRARKATELSLEDRSRFSSYSLRVLFDALRGSPVRTVQVIMGAEVHRPHRSIACFGDELLRGMARLFGECGDLHFSLSSASDLFTQDIAILAKHFPNVSVAGYWWHTLYPFYIRKSLETRLDIVPANKIIAFFSDAYHAEWCYPKLRLVKRILADVLAARVESGLYTEDIAVSLVKDLLHGNAKRLYRL